jgi:hypothetical protein
MKWLYKYPQRAYPYDDLVRTNAARSRSELEYELLDTHVFDDDRYFDVFVEYAKAGPEDLLVLVTVANRGPDAASLHVLPTLWFRNTWSWTPGAKKPLLRAADAPSGARAVLAMHPELGERLLYVEGDAELLFTENETNAERLHFGKNASPYVKDAFHRYVIDGARDAVNPAREGTKCAAHVVLDVPAGGSRTLRLRMSPRGPAHVDLRGAFARFDETLAARRDDADAFYQSISPPAFTEDEARVFRQALAGMLWSKQYYEFDVSRWLEEHDAHPLLPHHRDIRNRSWFHMRNDDVISMPDKWEYPWYAAWDLAFHTVALNLVDADFARDQLELMLREDYLHPNGQIPAYEWNFGDVNPPVHAWATLFTSVTGHEDAREVEFLKSAFQKLLLNFTWWTNRKDPGGKNVFEGGFLGLDNIGVFDRSAPLPTGGSLEQADGTAWMAFYSQTMLALSLSIAVHDPAFEDMALKFLGHFMWITAAMRAKGPSGLWDEEDGFFYDVLRFPDGTGQRIKVRSMVGLLPLCAAAVVPGEVMTRFPRFAERGRELVAANLKLIGRDAPRPPGVAGRRLLSALDDDMLRRVLARMLDEEEFLSPHGIRSISRWHLEHPYVFDLAGREYSVAYEPAESDSGMFGGNSNWRGPIWMPVNALIVRALLVYYAYYGDDFQVECPTGSGRRMTLFEVAKELTRRLASIFLRDASGRRPVYGGSEKFQRDPHWRDLILFYEYFHGDQGAGVGASHQTGWTGAVTKLMQLFATVDAASLLKSDAAILARRPYHRG